MNFEKNEYFAIGVMSGTSLDGLDIALCRYFLAEGKWQFECIETCFAEYDAAFKETIRSCYSASARELVKIDMLFARFVGEQVKDFLHKSKYSIDLVASHGQTIFHAPAEGYTTQIGSGAIISSMVGLPVVSDFRQQDVTLGGQGAPLVPVGDALLFNKYAACINLGGFANISYDFNHNRIAYDICAVNFILNRLAQKLGLAYDNSGTIALKGKTITPLLTELNSNEFYHRKFPKSLGQEWVEVNITPLLNRFSDEKTEDLIRTYSEHIAIQICNELEKVSGVNVLITGGGAKNKFMIDSIIQNTQKMIIVPDEKIIDFKEAIIFGFLGVLRLRNETNCFASVTGATKDSCTGALYVP